MDKKIKLIALAITILGLSSCGDMFMKKKSSSGVKFNGALTCSLDAKAFADIMKYDISETINCLQTQLHTFIDLVKTDRPGYISEKTLLKFISTGAIDLGNGNITPIIKSIFDLTHVIVGGERGYIARDDLDRLIDFLRKFNQNILPVYAHFSDDSVDITFTNYKKRQGEIDIWLGAIARDLESLLKQNRSTLDQVDLFSFLDSFFAEDLLLAEKIKSLLFLKKVFLGGDKRYLSYVELSQALGKIGSLGVVAYDLIKLNTFKFSNDPISLVEVYKNDVKFLKELVAYSPQANESLFSLREVIDVLTIFEIDTFGIDIKKYLTEARILKGILIGKGGGEFVKSSEFHNLLDHLGVLTNQSHFFYRVYTHFQEELDSRQRVVSIDYSQLPTSSEQQPYLNNFARIVEDYKFFKGSNSTAVFNHDFHRNPGGIVEISIIEYLAALVMKEYGQKNPDARGGYHMTLDQTRDVVEDLRFLLKDQGIIKIGRRDSEGNIPTGMSVTGATENFVLMSTLFQYQSNGCNNKKVCMEIPELTEFLVGLVTAISIKDFFAQQMEIECGVAPGESFSVSCFRQKFVKVMHTRIDGDTLSLAEYMPSFSKYLDDMRGTTNVDTDPSNSSSYNLFLSEMESFTRTCTQYTNGQSVNMKGSDAFGVFAGLLNLESTLLRFDLDKDGKLDGVTGTNEVLNAYYTVYESAIQKLVAPNGGFMEKLSKSIFKYLIKYGKVPDTTKFKSIWQYVKFLLKFNKKADATRTTIATILKTLGEQSDTAKNFPFDCDQCIDNDCQDQAGPYWDRAIFDSNSKSFSY